jgi:Predicted nucleotide-binding protein containing TIR-like domain
MTVKPRIFIGSSVEGLPIAEHLQLGLDYYAECTLWSQGVFGLSGGTLESLVRAASEFQFAILVLTPDDLVQKRSQTKNSPRDNVLFELGLFMGALGPAHTYIVYCRDTAIDIPTDLAAVTAATFAKRADNNLQAALGPVCTQVKGAIERAKKENPSGLSRTEELRTLTTEIAFVKAELAAQTADIRRMLQSLTSNSHPAGESKISHANELRFLEGVWTNDEQSTYCMRILRDELRCVYCFGGDSEATAEMYSWRLVDTSLFAKFRWFDRSISGYVYFRIESPLRLDGGWWYGEDVPEHAIAQLPHVDKMRRYVWTRQAGIKVYSWADKYFESFEQTGVYPPPHTP